MENQTLQEIMHNLRGELTAVKNGLSFVLEGRIGSLDDATKRFLQQIYERNEKAIALTFEYKNLPAEAVKKILSSDEGKKILPSDDIPELNPAQSGAPVQETGGTPHGTDTTR